MNKKKIFVVDDEMHIRELIQYNLEKNGYDVTSFETGEELLGALKDNIDCMKEYYPELILLDLMLPGIDGLDVCRSLRADENTKHIPIIMLTAKGEEVDKVVGLEMGADDYITKPFGVRELSARIKAVLRRIPYKSDISSNEEIIRVRDIIIDFKKREVFKGNQCIQLTLKEFELLKILVLNKGNVLSRDVLLNKVWGYDYFGETRTVDVHIRHLRKLLEDESGVFIETIRGIGYKFKE